MVTCTHMYRWLGLRDLKLHIIMHTDGENSQKDFSLCLGTWLCVHALKFYLVEDIEYSFNHNKSCTCIACIASVSPQNHLYFQFKKYCVFSLSEQHPL